MQDVSIVCSIEIEEGSLGISGPNPAWLRILRAVAEPLLYPLSYRGDWLNHAV
jgi:hypothetical protein